MKTQKVIILGLLTSFALILSYIESLVPFFMGVPGIKLGLANLAVVLTLYLFGAGEAFLINMLRIILAGFLFGNMFSILFSLSGGIISFFVMYFMHKMNFSIYGVSIGGGVFHNLGQILVAIFIVKTMSVGYYAPVLAISGIITGYLIALISNQILKRLPNLKEY